VNLLIPGDIEASTSLTKEILEKLHKRVYQLHFDRATSEDEPLTNITEVIDRNGDPDLSKFGGPKTWIGIVEYSWEIRPDGKLEVTLEGVYIPGDPITNLGVQTTDRGDSDWTDSEPSLSLPSDNTV
jgi:hypothetical protein